MQRLLLIFGLLIIFVTSFANDNVKFALQQSKKTTSVIIDIGKNVDYKDFTLDSPSRFVLDLQDTSLHWQNKALILNPVIKTIRHATDYKNNHLRLVFDLKYKTSISVDKVTLSHGIRLIVKFNNKVSISHGRDVVIVIDPGHGGKDPGASGRHYKKEKDIVLSIAKKLQQSINQQQGFKAYLTRSTDHYLTLRQRLAIARRYHADMFVAIHADAYKRKAAHGASVYALSLRGATSEAARWLASRENDSELMGGVELNDKSQMLKSVLLNLSQTATLRASLKIGEAVLSNLSQVAHLHHNKVEQAAFVVLKSPDIPSLLIETGFISNYREELKLSSAAYQRRLASAIMQGIQRYFVARPPRDTWLARQ